MRRKKNMPDVVYWGLIGINSRSGALVYFWACLAAGTVFFIGGFMNSAMRPGALLLLAAAWYWNAITWADKNSAWDDKS